MIIEEGPVVDEGFTVSWRTSWESITAGLAAMNGASVQNRSRASGTTAALSDKFAGFVGAIVGDYKPDKASRMVQEY